MPTELRRRSAGSSWLTWPRLTLLAALGSWLVLMVRVRGCRPRIEHLAGGEFEKLCYSDIPVLFRDRGLIDGFRPYVDSGGYPPLEYPVGTGYLIEVNRIIAIWFAPTGVDRASRWQATLAFVDVNAVVLFVLFVLTVIAHLRLGRPKDALLIAAAPVVMAAGMINWDLLAVALTSWALLAWSRGRPLIAGILLGCAVAAKLYPVVLLGPLLLLCLRAGRMRAYAYTVAGAAAAWAVLNLPVFWRARGAWAEFWTYNTHRGADLGSPWYLLQLLGVRVPNLNLTWVVAFIACCAGIAAVIMFAPRRPRLGQVAFLVVVALLLTNKVYSPQYVLWLLPLLVLARPTTRSWVVFTAAELYYFLAVWWHLSGATRGVDGATDGVYLSAILVRVGVQVALAVCVVGDIWRPRRDPLRQPVAGRLIDDPIGGPLNGANDVSWWPRGPASTPPPVPREGHA